MAEPVKERKLEKIRILGDLERGLDDVDKKLARGNTDIEFDFSACPFISVDGLEWLEEFLLRADSLKSTVTFVNVQNPVYKVFKVAHIDSLMRACGAPNQESQGLSC